MGKVVKVKKVPAPQVRARLLLAKLCYYYPQYTFAEARKLSARDVNLLIKTAMQQEAIKYYNLTQIAAAPHSKKGQAVKKLADKFRGLIDG